MSPRAACRLATIGFSEVYDYVAGKADWLAHGLPVEGEQAEIVRAGNVARDDVVTCRLEDPIVDLRDRVKRSPYGFALVTTDAGVLLGRLRATTMKRALSDAPTETVMEGGPSTVRADTPAAELSQRLRQRELTTAIVSTPEGRLIGVARRADLEAAST